MQIKFQIKKSSIPGAGLGIFADQFVTKGDLVWLFLKQYNVLYHSSEEYKQILSTMDYDRARDYIAHTYVYDENIVAYEFENSAGRYMNHSKNGNIISSEDDYNSYAARDIQKGEELTWDYVEYGTPIWFEQINKEYNVWWPTIRNKSRL